MSGADIVVQVLADEGVGCGDRDYSGGAILPVYDAVFRFNHAHLRADGSEPLPLIVPANRLQGAGFYGAGLCACVGQGRCRNRHLGSGRNKYSDAGARCDGRFNSDRGDLWPGADCSDWYGWI